ncbi:CdiA C-terminal domain-containing protein [Corynebacterium uterequi]|uniref:CdiA C-terminal domain-containing protein n=1 Tax=Corynebacterium uterequi TaxID=1072256 RepID=UPI0038B29642
MVTYQFLVDQGHHIQLIPRSDQEKVKTPDCYVDGARTEVKAPNGSSKNTVYQNVRRARSQAPRIVIDLHRSGLDVQEALRQVEDAVRRYAEVEEVTVISQGRLIVKRRRK